MGYEISYDGDDHTDLGLFMSALLRHSDGHPWCVQVTHAATPDGDPTEHTADYALLGATDDEVHLRPWPDEEGVVPPDTGADVHVDVDRISRVQVY